MGAITALLDPKSNNVLITFPKTMAQIDRSFTRRSGTYAIWAVDGGVNPYDGGPMPIAVRQIQQQYRVWFPGSGGDLDGAYDALLRVVGPGTRVRVEYTPTGNRAKRYWDGYPVGYPLVITVDEDICADFKVIYEVDPLAQDRNSIGTIRVPPDANTARALGLVVGASGLKVPESSEIVCSATITSIYLFTDGTTPVVTTNAGGTRTTPSKPAVPTADATKMKIVLRGPLAVAPGSPASGYVPGIAIGNQTTNVQFWLDFGIPSGGRVDIDTGTRTVKLTNCVTPDGRPGWAHLFSPLAQSVIFKIKANVRNDLLVAARDGASSMGGSVELGYQGQYF